MPADIRPLRPDDVDAVVEFSLRAWAPVFDSFRAVLGERVYRALYPDWRSAQATAVRDVCTGGATRVWVADRHGGPVGFVAVKYPTDEGGGEIEMLAVDPAEQRRGIGTALTTFAVRQLRDAGMPLVAVGTGGDPGHAPARRTYERAGFVALPLVRYYAALGGDEPGPPAAGVGSPAG